MDDKSQAIFYECRKSIRFYPENININSVTEWSIVLDLDETLVHTMDNYKDFLDLNVSRNTDLMDVRHRIYSFSMQDVFTDAGYGDETKIWGIFRPHVKEFIEFANKYFRSVNVWSAGQPSYVEKIVDKLFKGHRHPAIIYAFNQCKSNDGDTLKPLHEMINSFNYNYSNKTNHTMSLEKIFSVDDRRSTFNSNVKNGILIPAYAPEEIAEENATLEDIIRMEDDSLLKLIEWFDNLNHKEVKDVRHLSKMEIF